MESRDPVEPLSPEALRKRCDPARLPFETTADIEATDTIIGQDRAVRAIRLGLAIPAEGYNTFVAGHAGTGRNSTINRFLEEIEKDGPAPPDLAYVHNFDDPDRPRLLVLPAGSGSKLRDALGDLIRQLRKQIPATFESDEYARQRKAFLEGYREREKALFKAFEERVEAENFALVQMQMGPISRPTLVPVLAGNPTRLDQLEELVEKGKFALADFQRIAERHDALTEDLDRLLKQVRETAREADDRLGRLDSDLILPLVHDPLVDLRKEHPQERAGEYFDKLEDALVSDLDRFRGTEEEGSSSSAPRARDPFLEYRVNLIVDNGATRGAPVVNETSPSYKNLFGSIERALDRSGEWRTDFMRIKAGSLVRANGGFIVLNANDVLREPGVWTALKTALRNRSIEIQTYDPVFMFTASVLKPEPIQSNVKVLMVGDRELYHLLYNLDPDFRKIFKVKAEFDTTMRTTGETVLEYARFVRKITRDERLPAFDRAGVAAIVEHGARLSGRGDRVTTRFVEIADVIRESAWSASRQGATVVSAAHVREALRARRERISLTEEKLREAIDEGRILIDVGGTKVGQVNGLAVFDLGDHAFGVPSRITATLSMGRAGIVNIEREAEMSGPTHDKGVLILSGFLRSRFAQDKPLTLSASLCFEQSYGAVDGDSASSTEIYALLSAIAEAPIRQDLAVTGSVNQKGEVQPIGGVNEKVEGWFAACRARGLTGTQGVLIPALNAADLMLDEEVVQAARAGKFAIYPIWTVEQGIALLAGLPAGERDAAGQFTQGSLFARVDARLRELAEKIREFGPSSPHDD